MRPTTARRIAGGAAAVLLLAAAMAAVAAMACSASSKGAAARDAGALDDVSPGVEAAAEAMENGDGNVYAEPEGGPAGYVFFSMDPGAGTSSLGAVFDDDPVPAAHCHVTSVYGACVVFTCAGGSDAGSTATAGTLTFDAPSLDGGVGVDADPSGLYEAPAQGALFGAGDPLTVTASGGQVPAFGPSSVAAPGLITLTSPLVEGGALTVSTSSDLSFAWTGGSVDSVAILSASGAATDGSLVVARCSYVAITDEGILPSAVLMPLHGLTEGAVGWGQANAATVDAGAWSVTLLAGAYGSTPATFE
ncbi:MAG TPA: hypothetical protein VGL81_20480 [Polyangiaceae bacterium]|jgi:hypothetical protein